jgi:hypothetical protein
MWMLGFATLLFPRLRLIVAEVAAIANRPLVSKTLFNRVIDGGKSLW